MAKINVYCLSGLGADERLFSNISLQYGQLYHIPYIIPKRKETFEEYSQRLLEKVDVNSPYILMGSSFGGLAAIEMAKLSQPLNTIIISSVRTKNELPGKVKVFKQIPLYKIMPINFIKFCRRFIRPLMGDLSKEENELFTDMLLKTNNQFWKWAAHQVLHWEHTDSSLKLIQIHGSNDKLFPAKRITNPNYIIEGGTHYMMNRKGKEVSAIIDSELERLFKNP